MDEFDLENTPTFSESDARILLSSRDYAQFAAMLDSPKPPTPELQAAMAEYQRLKAAYPEANV